MNKQLLIDLHRCDLSGPGLADWEAAVPVLRGEQPYQPTVMGKPDVSELPARDRRRYTFAIALAVTTALKAIKLDGEDQIPAVFACSGGDADVINRLCTALMVPGCPMSPQQFVNSVHNAPAGYWSMAEQNNAPTLSLSAYDASFAAGLLEAAVQIHARRQKVLLIAYDVPAPMPIWPFRPLTTPFAVALMLTAPGAEGTAMAKLDLTLGKNLTETTLDQPKLESLRLGNPAARSLPLLEAIAGRRATDLTLPYLPPQQLGIRVTPC